MFGIFKRIKKLEDKLEEHISRTIQSFQEVRDAHRKMSGWDDDRRDEIRALADAAGLDVKKGVHLVPNEQKED
jgi:hypothetical protein